MAEIEVSEDDHAGKRFCGRCQTWIDTPIGELHFCVKAPRKIGYAWYEPDIQARAKNDIVTENRPFKRGKLIQRFPAEQHEEMGAQPNE